MNADSSQIAHTPFQIAMVAGETSGDILGALLLEGLHARGLGHQDLNVQNSDIQNFNVQDFNAQKLSGTASSISSIDFETHSSHKLNVSCQKNARAHFFGIGGSKMQAQGFQAQWPIEKLAVRGYVEVLKHYREISGIRQQLRQQLLSSPPDCFIGVDAPDFNLALEAQLKASGIPTVHFVGPSLWAWRGKRIHSMRAACSHVLLLFPFEKKIYDAHHVPASYVGHPLADVIPMQPNALQARAQLGYAEHVPLFALLPGSRVSEVRYMARSMVAAARLLKQKIPDAQFLLPLANEACRAQFELCVPEHAQLAEHAIRLLEGQSYLALEACDVTLVASGTASLEAALFKRPMVIVYKMAGITFSVMRRMSYLPWIGLPNILANQALVPELIQHAATPQAMADALLGQFENTAQRVMLQERFTEMHRSLQCNTAQKSAEVILDLLHQARTNQN